MRLLNGKTIFGLIIIAWISSPSSPTYGTALSEVVAQIQKRGIETFDLTASFGQESTSKYLEKPEVARGKFYFKKPKKMRWDYETPDKQEIVTDGTTLWIYMEEDRLVNIYEATSFLDSKLSITFLSFLSGEGDLEELFTISFAEGKEVQEEVYFVLKLVPKNPEAELRELFLWASKENFLVRKVQFSDFYGNVTRITLHDIHTNRNISDSKFVFSIPEGVEVVRQ